MFLPLLAWLVARHGWRSAALAVTAAALAVVPLVATLLRERPADLGLLPYGATEADPEPTPAGPPGRSWTGSPSAYGPGRSGC